MVSIGRPFVGWVLLASYLFSVTLSGYFHRHGGLYHHGGSGCWLWAADWGGNDTPRGVSCRDCGPFWAVWGGKFLTSGPGASPETGRGSCPVCQFLAQKVVLGQVGLVTASQLLAEQPSPSDPVQLPWSRGDVERCRAPPLAG